MSEGEKERERKRVRKREENKGTKRQSGKELEKSQAF